MFCFILSDSYLKKEAYMRDMEIATNEAVVIFNQDILRSIREPDTRLKSQKAACARCHIIPGIAEPTQVWNGKLYDISCLKRVQLEKRTAV